MEGLTKYIFFPLVKLTFIIYAHIYELQRWQKCSKFKWNQEAQPKSLKQSFIIDYLSILVSVKIIINMLAVLIRIKTVLIWWPSLKLTYLFYSMNTTLIRGTYNYNFFSFNQKFNPWYQTNIPFRVVIFKFIRHTPFWVVFKINHHGQHLWNCNIINYLISKLVCVQWLINLAGHHSLPGWLNSKVCSNRKFSTLQKWQ